jgi:pyruvate/2-oxoglutarate dehydrogenase complex dihydrolipoamide acyltransferase (E2) component
VTLPRLADSLEEGIVSRWLKRPGDRVTRGEPLVEIETDKVNSEIESPYDGVLAELLVAEGATVPVGEVIARVDPPHEIRTPGYPPRSERGGTRQHRGGPGDGG